MQWVQQRKYRTAESRDSQQATASGAAAHGDPLSARGGKPEPLFNVLGHALLREDAEFHTFQMYEAAVAEYDHWASESGPFAERARETLILAVTVIWRRMLRLP